MVAGDDAAQLLAARGARHHPQHQREDTAGSLLGPTGIVGGVALASGQDTSGVLGVAVGLDEVVVVVVRPYEKSFVV